MDDLISKLSEIRSDYNCFSADEEPYYHALSEAIRILSQLADGDTISRQAAIDAVHVSYDEIFDFKSTGRTVADSVEDIISDLPSAQPEQKKDEWIPISKETNPTKSGWYLVTSHENATIENKLFTVIAEFNATNGMWYDIDEPTDMYLRWMPLPAPYRGGGKE